MRRFLSILTSLLIPALAQAADQAPRAQAIKAPPVVPAYGAFYIIVDGGAGVSDQQNELTIPGLVVQGTPKQWPTGPMLGTGAGVEAVLPIGKVQGELHGNYAFTAASFGCAPVVGCSGATKNSWVLQEMVYYSPVAAPLSFTGWQWAQGVGLYAGVGAAERFMAVRLNDLVGGSVENSAVFSGFDVGVKAELPITAQTKARITYDWARYDHRITQAGALAFPAAFSLQQEHFLRAGLDFHF